MEHPTAADEPMVQLFQTHQAMKDQVANQFIQGNGTFMFLHFRKNGGTTMCSLAKVNGLRVPGKDSVKSGFDSSMGKNCNPPIQHMKGWWGTKEQQLKWIKREGIQYYGHEVHFPRPEDVPWETVVVGTALRHPVMRLYSMFKENAIITPVKAEDTTTAITTASSDGKLSLRPRDHRHRVLFGDNGRGSNPRATWDVAGAMIQETDKRASKRSKPRIAPKETNTAMDAAANGGSRSNATLPTATKAGDSFASYLSRR